MNFQFLMIFFVGDQDGDAAAERVKESICALYSIPNVICTKEEEKEHTHTYLEMWHDYIILTTVLLYFFIRAMSIGLLFSKINCKLKVTSALKNVAIIQIMARPFLKASGIGSTVNFDFASLYLVFGGRFLNARYVNLN